MRRDHAEILSERPLGTSIPRVLHQVYLVEQLPESLAEVTARVRAANPGWEYRFYDDERVVEHVRSRYGEEVVSYLDRIDRRYAAAKADLFRYLLLYADGGVYLDVKSLTERPLDEVIDADDTFLISQWDTTGERFQGFGEHPELADVPGGEYQQWWLASAPGHPFLRAAILRVMRNIDDYRVRRGAGVERLGVLRTTGPIAFTLAVREVEHLHPHRRLAHEREAGLRYSALPGLTHAHQDGGHYSRQWRPVVNVGGLRGVENHLTAGAVKAYWVLDWRVRDLLGRRPRSRR